VILPAQTFVASGLVILMCGAKPVFADIDPRTGNIDPTSIRSKITSRTRAIMPVHWGGYPCDLDEINAIATEHDLLVVEDAAHALGATYKGRPIGSISRMTAFSFQAIKHVTTGDGGALACLDAAEHEQTRIRRWFGIDRANSTPSILGEREYDIASVGYKYHLNDLGAALGIGNLECFPETLAHHRDIASHYRAALDGADGIELLENAPDRVGSYWMFTMLVERREDLIRRLAEHDIPASVVHLRIDTNSVFGGKTPDLHGQEEFNRRQLALPVHMGITRDDVKLAAKIIRGGW
jgi:perosamine synthetase